MYTRVTLTRWNSEGIRRDQLMDALKDRTVVRTARRVDYCILCMRRSVNEAGLCDVCASSLEGEELHLVERWVSGVGP